MEQFQERLARLAELSPEELGALEGELVAAFDAADEAGDLESMQAFADALDQVRAAKANSGTGEAPAAPPMEAPPVAASATESDPEPAPESTEESEVEETPAPEEGTDAVEVPAPEEAAAPEADESAPAEAAADEGDETEAEAEAAPESESESDASESEEPVAEITADEVPEENRPVQAAAPVVTIRAGGDIPGYTAGAELSGMDGVNEALTKKINTMRGISGDGEHIIVASMKVEEPAPEGHILRPGDLDGNSRKIRELLGDKEQLTPQGLTASAWCAPRAPIYDVPTVGTTRRPLRDGLPTFTADRGGVTWMQPPGLPDLTAAAVGLWRYDGTQWEAWTNPAGTAAASPADEKPCFDVPCGAELTADVDAITLCLCFTNMMSRAFPEWVRANTDLTMVAQARFAEQVLLSKMYALAATGGVCGTPTTQVGVARDFFLTIQTAAAAHRWRLRLDEDAPLQLLAPSWIATAMAVDLGLQAPGDDKFVTSASDVRGYFNEVNVDPLFFIDDAPASTAFTGCAFPATVDWMLFPTGSFIRLDSGELNLGVVRTKEDVQKNKYCEFSETFETVAYMGPASPDGWVTTGTTQVDIIGSAAALTDTSP